MIKIYLPNLNNKFINNLKLINNNTFQFYTSDNKDIYRIHSKITPNIYIFDSANISNDIFEFISEYGDMEAKIYIHHQRHTYNKDAIRYIKKAKHLIDHTIYSNYKNYHNAIEIPINLINSHIYTTANNTQYKQNIKAYFLDNDSSIPSSLVDKLYPNTKEKILMFNNSNIKHTQNLGLLLEIEKPLILNSVKYFIANSFLDYVTEAVSCGCCILDISNFEDITELCISRIGNTIQYIDFLKKSIL